MTVTLTPEMEEIINEQLATGQYTSRAEVLRVALLGLGQQYVDLKAAVAVGMDDIRQGRVAPLDVAATLARVQARQAATVGAEPCGS